MPLAVPVQADDPETDSARIRNRELSGQVGRPVHQWPERPGSPIDKPEQADDRILLRPQRDHEGSTLPIGVAS